MGVATARLNSALRCLFYVDLLTLAGTDHFASFDGTRGGGDAPRVWPLIELEPRGKKTSCRSSRDEANVAGFSGHRTNGDL